MRIFKFLVGLPVFLVGVALGVGFLASLFPIESVNWFGQFVRLIIAILFIKVGWGLMRGEKAQLRSRSRDEVVGQ